MSNLANTALPNSPAANDTAPAQVTARRLLDMLGPTRRAFIPRRGEEFYPMLARGVYSERPCTRSELAESGVQFFTWAVEANLMTIDQADKKGRMVKRSTTDLLTDYGYSVASVAFTLSPDSGRYGIVDDTLWLCRVKHVSDTPRFDPGVDAWLRAMAGASAEQLLDWLAALRRVSHPLPALVLDGARAAGKSFLALNAALALGQSQATDLTTVFGQFQDTLLSGPVLNGDEMLPAKTGLNVDTGEYLKRLITSDRHQVNRKNASVVYAHGHVRLILSANNVAKLLTVTDDSRESKAALADRFLRIEAQPAARDYLQRIGGRAATDEWVRDRRVVRHILWLVLQP